MSLQTKTIAFFCYKITIILLFNKTLINSSKISVILIYNCNQSLTLKDTLNKSLIMSLTYFNMKNYYPLNTLHSNKCRCTIPNNLMNLMIHLILTISI